MNTLKCVIAEIPTIAYHLFTLDETVVYYSSDANCTSIFVKKISVSTANTSNHGLLYKW